MKTGKNLRILCFTVAVVVLAAALSGVTALAYFTTYVTAKGQVTLDLGFADTKISEEITVEEGSGWKKITLTNTGEAESFVRVKAFSAESLTYWADAEKTKVPAGWNLERGYYVYQETLHPGESTVSPLYVHFDLPGKADAGEYNVIIIQESTQVLRREDGTILPANWETSVGDPTVVR